MDPVYIVSIIATLIIMVLGFLYLRLRGDLRVETMYAESLDQQTEDLRNEYQSMVKELSDKRVDDLYEAEQSYNSKLRKLLNRSTAEITEMQLKHGDIVKEKDQKYRVLLAQKKSSEVKTGYILEKVAPLFEDFPADLASDTVIPLFDVVDYLIFKDNEIIFCEVKSGDSSLSQRQKRFKKNVKEGRVTYRVFRKRAPEGLGNEQKAEESTV